MLRSCVILFMLSKFLVNVVYDWEMNRLRLLEFKVIWRSFLNIVVLSVVAVAQWSRKAHGLFIQRCTPETWWWKSHTRLIAIHIAARVGSRQSISDNMFPRPLVLNTLSLLDKYKDTKIILAKESDEWPLGKLLLPSRMIFLSP